MPYFNPTYKHADWVDAVLGLWDPISISGWAEALVVRVTTNTGGSDGSNNGGNDSGANANVPAPAAVGLFGLAMLAFAGLRRRR